MLHWLLCLTCILFSSLETSADDYVKAKDSLHQLTKHYNELAKLLGQIDDDNSAKAVKPRLVELTKQYEELTDLVKTLKLTEEQKNELAKQSSETSGIAREAVYEVHEKLLNRKPEIYRLISELELIKEIQGEMEYRASNTAFRLHRAMKVHFDEKKEWPATLEMLLIGNQKKVVDPWNKPYQFAIATDDTGKQQAYVWTISPFGDGKKVLGTMPPKK